MVSETWHHGLVARWWAEFNVGGPEVDYFRPFVERGQPALDAGCGTGRLLVPYLASGLDVDGCDVSGDMIALCRERAEHAGLVPTLLVQALHELDAPRRYRTIVVCGAFGLGSSRDEDHRALERFYEHLEPGGTLVLDNEVPYANELLWSRWTKRGRAELPAPWGPTPEPRRASDGADYALQSRHVALDALEQRATLAIRAYRWRDGVLEAEEEHSLTMNLYFTPELRLMLERAGFVDVQLFGDHTSEPPTSESDFVVFVARRPL